MRRLARFTSTWERREKRIAAEPVTLNEALDYAATTLDWALPAYRTRQWLKKGWDDVRQEALTRVWRKWPLWDGKRHWRPWVKTLLVNALKNAIRDDTPNRAWTQHDRLVHYRFINPIRLGHKQLVDENETYVIEALPTLISSFRASLPHDRKRLFNRYLETGEIGALVGMTKTPITAYRRGHRPQKRWTYQECAGEVRILRKLFREAIAQST